MAHSALLLYSSDIIDGKLGAVRFPKAWLGDGQEDATVQKVYLPNETAPQPYAMDMAARDDILHTSHHKYLLTFGRVVLGAVSQMYFVQNTPSHELAGTARKSAGRTSELIYM